MHKDVWDRVGVERKAGNAWVLILVYFLLLAHLFKQLIWHIFLHILNSLSVLYLMMLTQSECCAF